MRSHTFHYGTLAGGYFAVVNYVVRMVGEDDGKQQLMPQVYKMSIRDLLEDLDVCVGYEPIDIPVEETFLSNTGTRKILK